ncbi:MAG: MBL fold metallo-hydrolase [Gammaproteobacteria bacterium]|nr:MBL fold metallo-hydrolase [Gammaproteobacteria bacterium]
MRRFPKILYLGHAGLFIESSECALLCDPWFSPSGAQIHRLHQFPRNDIFALSEFDATKFIYISHEHGDHFDPEFLFNFLGRDVTILLADFVSDVLYWRIRELGFEKIWRLKDWEVCSLGSDCSVQIVCDPARYRIDSSIIIDVAGVHILNFNDSHIAPEGVSRLRDFGIVTVRAILWCTLVSPCSWIR